MIDKNTWISQIQLAEQWLITYAIAPTKVKFFAVAHAMELYIKAAYTKQFAEELEALAQSGQLSNKHIIFTHKVKDLIAAIRQEDSSFMPDYELRDVFFEKRFANCLFGNDGTVDGPNGTREFDILSEEMRMHFLKNMALYQAVILLPDLKYVGLSFKGRTGYAIGIVWPDPYWLKFFQQLRMYFKKDLQAKSYYSDGLVEYLGSHINILDARAYSFLYCVAHNKDC